MPPPDLGTEGERAARAFVRDMARDANADPFVMNPALRAAREQLRDTVRERLALDAPAPRKPFILNATTESGRRLRITIEEID